MTKKREKKIKSGGVYWVDFTGFKLPEWGNSPTNNPHLGILVSSGDFAGKEMYICFPLSSQKKYIERYGDKLVQRIVLEDAIHYALINHIRIIGKHRVLSQFRLVTGTNIFVESSDLTILKDKFNDYFSSKMKLAIRDLAIKESKNE